jgi:hypothetical protein
MLVRVVNPELLPPQSILSRFTLPPEAEALK